MRQELIRVHNDSDRLEERLAALEADQAIRARQSARAPGAGHPSHPQLKVVRLEPEAEASAAEQPEEAPISAAALGASSPAAEKSSDSASRPVIKGTGQKVYSTHNGVTSAAPEAQPKPKSSSPASSGGGS